MIAPLLALVFESPLRVLVQLLVKLPYVWMILLPFVLMRFLFSVVPALIASRIAAQAPPAPPLADCSSKRHL